VIHTYSLSFWLYVDCLSVFFNETFQQYFIITWQWLATGLWFFPGTPVSSIKKIDRHDITEILLKVTLKHLDPNPISCIPILYKPLSKGIVLTKFWVNMFNYRSKLCWNSEKFKWLNMNQSTCILYSLMYIHHNFFW
jgi:hypothetical protein